MSLEEQSRLPAWSRSVPVPRLVTPHAWLLLGLLSLLLLPAGLFGLCGSLPIRVEGRALLLQPDGLVGLYAPGAGCLRAYALEAGAWVDSGQVVCWLDTPELSSALEDARAALQALEQEQARAALAARSFALQQRAHLDQQQQELQAALDERQAARNPNEEQRQSLLAARSEQLQHSLADAQLRIEEQRAESTRVQGLVDRGMAARSALDAASSALREAQQQVVALTTEQTALVVQRLELRERSQQTDRALARLEQQLAALQLERLRLEQSEQREAAEAEQQHGAQLRRIARLEAQISAESCLRAPAAGRILDLRAAEGSHLASGQPLGSLQLPETGELRALAYLNQIDGGRVVPGQPVLLAPDGLPRSRYGSLQAVVEQVASFPVSAAEALELSGHPALATELTGEGRFIRVWLRLEQEDGDFLWTSESTADRKLSHGMLAGARVEVGSRRPIGLLLPRLEDWLEGNLP